MNEVSACYFGVVVVDLRVVGEGISYVWSTMSYDIAVIGHITKA